MFEPTTAGPPTWAVPTAPPHHGHSPVAVSGNPPGSASAVSAALSIGDVVDRAACSGLRVEAEVLPDGAFLDIGTPEDLARAALWVERSVPES